MHWYVHCTLYGCAAALNTVWLCNIPLLGDDDVGILADRGLQHGFGKPQATVPPSLFSRGSCRDGSHFIHDCFLCGQI